VSRLLLAEDSSTPSPRKQLLMEKLGQMSFEILNINESKLNCAMKINNLITNKYREYVLDLSMQQHPCELSPVSGGFIPNVTSSAETKVPKKRGRKPKKETLDAPASNCDLMMLAVLALKQEQESKAGTKTFGKLPVSRSVVLMTFLSGLNSLYWISQVTKHSKKVFRRRRKSKTPKDDTSSEEDMLPDDAEDNEPVYCLCNRPSFGNMVECSNDACSIEWFHFSCVQLKKAPKGKW
jgi:hypothetical protein